MDAKEAKEAKEAIKTLRQMKIQYFCELFEHRALTLGAEALEKVPVLEAENERLREKETPKAISKRTYNFRGEEVGICPNNHKVAIYDNYCPICGQKLDWSSDKE